MARRRVAPVEFLMNDEGACWATFDITRRDETYLEETWQERLWACKQGDKLAFGRTHGGYEAGSDDSPHWNAHERAFRIAVLRRIVDNGLPNRLTGGRFSDKTDYSVTYTTTCGEIRIVSLDVLRQIVEDAEQLP